MTSISPLIFQYVQVIFLFKKNMCKPFQSNMVLIDLLDFIDM